MFIYYIIYLFSYYFEIVLLKIIYLLFYFLVNAILEKQFFLCTIFKKLVLFLNN